MLISIFPTALVTCLAISQAVAAPLGIFVITSPGVNIEAPPPFRLGHAAANVVLPPAITKPGCGGGVTAIGRTGSLERVVRISNRFRAKLGLPLIKEEDSTIVATHMNSTYPHRFPIRYGAEGVGRTRAERIAWRRRGPFAQRLQRGLLMLGPWEGRAVSFVLGCGLGALLRMLFVFAVLLRRSIKGPRNTVASIRLEEGSTDAIVPPPAYSDEKELLEPKIVEEVSKEPSKVQVITIEKEDDKLMVVWHMDNEEFSTETSEFAKLYPQELISFYEANLRWKEAEAEA